MKLKATSARTPVRPPEDPARPYVPSLDSLDEITVWLGTFRERLRIARGREQYELRGIVTELEVHYARRRAELA